MLNWLIIWILILGLIFLPVYCFEWVEYDCKKIVSIGVCAQNGHCAVIVDDGQKRFERFPMVGEMSCLNELKWRWK